MGRKLFNIYKNEFLLYILIFLLMVISATIFTALNVSSKTLAQGYAQFSQTNNKNDFIITPDYNQLDRLIDNINIYQFDDFHNAYINTGFDLDFDNILNQSNNQYLTAEDIHILQTVITEKIIAIAKTSNKPSLVLYNPVYKAILDSMSTALPAYYRSYLAGSQAETLTRDLLLLTLNDDNYMKFVEFSLDAELMARDSNGNYYPATIAARYHLTITKKLVKTVQETLHGNSVNYYLTTAQELMNQPYVIDSLSSSSTLVLNPGEIAIFKEFADKNHLSLGDCLTIDNHAFKITSFVYLPDAVYPIFNPNQYFFNAKEDTAVLFNPDDFTKITAGKYDTVLYTAKFNQPQSDLNAAISHLQKEFTGNEIFLSVSQNPGDIIVNTNINNLNLLSFVISYSILIISLLFIVIILIRRLNDESRQIGILKAMGYSNRHIIFSYIRIHFFVALVSVLIGFGSGLLAAKIILSYLYQMFLLPYKSMAVTDSTVIDSAIPLIIVFGVTYVVTSLKLRAKAVNLINKTNSVNIGKRFSTDFLVLGSFLLTAGLTVLAQKISDVQNLFYFLFAVIVIYLWFICRRHCKRSFLIKTAMILSNRNIKKIISFLTAVTISAMLIFFATYSLYVYQDELQNVKETNRYAEYVKYPDILNLTDTSLSDCGESGFVCQGFVSYTFTVMPIDKVIYINGYAQMPYLMNAVDTSLLTGNQVMVTKPFADKYNVKINDMLTIITNEIVPASSLQKAQCTFDSSQYCATVDVKVTSIAPNYTGLAIYTSLKNANFWHYGDTTHANHINTIYTAKSLNNLPSSSILHKDILISYNVTDITAELGRLFFTLVAVVDFTFILIMVLSTIILITINELSLKENLEQIALLKAMGYRNKEINVMLLGYNKPFLYFSFLLAFPAAFSLITLLFNLIGKNMSRTLPVNPHYQNLLYVFLFIYLIYHIANVIALLRIKSISLSSQLKN